MVNPTIIEEVPMLLADVKEELEKNKKIDGELNIRAGKTQDYLAPFTTLNLKKAKEMAKKLMDLNIPRVKEQHVFKVVDLMPKTLDELKVILQGYTITVSNDNMKKIVDILNESSS